MSVNYTTFMAPVIDKKRSAQSVTVDRPPDHKKWSYFILRYANLPIKANKLTSFIFFPLHRSLMLFSTTPRWKLKQLTLTNTFQLRAMTRLLGSAATKMVYWKKERKLSYVACTEQVTSPVWRLSWPVWLIYFLISTTKFPIDGHQSSKVPSI